MKFFFVDILLINLIKQLVMLLDGIEKLLILVNQSKPLNIVISRNAKSLNFKKIFHFFLKLYILKSENY